MPASSTHILQPLDVSSFQPLDVSPLKRSWRKILEDEKRSCREKPCSLAKDSFSLLLNRLYKNVCSNAVANLKSGFQKCGLLPLNVEKPLAVLPHVPAGDDNVASDSTSAMDDSLIAVLQEMRYGSATKVKASRRKKLQVEREKSVGSADLPSTSADNSLEDSDDQDKENQSAKKEDDDFSYSVGNFVKFVYEGEYFPGKIISINDNGYDKVHGRSGFNWKWPQHENIMLYPFSDIIKKIASQGSKKRGAFLFQNRMRSGNF